MAKVCEYLFDGESIIFPLINGHTRDDVVVNVQRRFISAGFKGERAVVSGTLLYEVLPEDCLWSTDGRVVTIDLEFKRAPEVRSGEKAVIIAPKDLGVVQKGMVGDCSDMDPHSIYLYGNGVGSAYGFDVALDVWKLAADYGHYDAIAVVTTLYLGNGQMLSGDPGTAELINLKLAKHYLLLGAEIWESADFFYSLGGFEGKYGDPEEEIKWLTKASDIGDDHSTIRLAEIALSRNNVDHGIELLDGISDHSSEAAMILAMTLYNTEKYPEALKYYEMSKKLNPDIEVEITLDDIKSKLPEELEKIPDEEVKEPEKKWYMNKFVSKIFVLLFAVVLSYMIPWIKSFF